MKYILNKILILLVIQSNFILGQTTIINHQKYWYYKTRFNNDFIKVGKKQGESIPFNQRAINQKGYSTLGGQNSVDMKAGDGPSSVGSYIAALATEYALLKANNQNTDSVKHELFCALNAINRLDDFSEPLWAWAGGQHIPLNGFFIRDDVPRDFLKSKENYAHFNYYSNWDGTLTSWGDVPNSNNDKGFCSQIYSGQFKVESSTYSNIINENESPDVNTMSTDHVITLLVGLSLVNKYVDYSATDNGQVFPYEGQSVSSLKQEAWNIVDRFAQHYKNDPQYNLRNPVTNQIVQPGGQTIFTQYGLAESFCKSEGFTAGPSSPFVPLLNSFGSLVPFTCNYSTPYVQLNGLPAWGAFITSPSTSVDNAGFKCHLLATGNSGWLPAPVNVASSVCNWVSSNICNQLPWPWGTICNTVNQVVCNTVIVPVPGFKNETPTLLDINVNEHYGIEQLKEIQVRNYDFWHAPLLHRALFPSNTSVNYTVYLPIVKNMLDDAPCVGPYNFGQFARPNFEWTCENRLEKSNNRQDFNEPDKGWNAHLDVGSSKLHTKDIFLGESNGVDYMVYHNLYRLTNSIIPGTGSYQNLSHRYINIPLPQGSFCSKPIICMFRAFETIVADNTISNNGAVDFKAGKTITLKPGFYAASGADFHAYIEAANCNNGSAGLRMANDTTQPQNNFAGYDEMGDNIITHYVDYSNVKDSVRENLIQDFFGLSIIEQDPESNNTSVPIIIENQKYFNVYPNPAFENINISFSLEEKETAKLVILNYNGAIVFESDARIEKHQQIILNTSGLAKGMYLVRLTTNTNRIEMKKVTIQ